jgi:hypothetical protein
VARTAPESDDDERSLDDDFQAQLAHQILSAMIARDAR